MKVLPSIVLAIEFLGVFSGAFVACTTDQPSSSKPPATPVQENVAPPVPGEPYLHDNPPELALGMPCKASDVEHCGSRSRVSVTIGMRGASLKKGAPPCELKVVTALPGAEQASACMKDDRIYVTGYCLACRNYPTWDMTGIVSEMTEAQLSRAQLRATLPEEPLLRTPEAWRTAFAGAAAKAARSNR